MRLLHTCGPAEPILILIILTTILHRNKDTGMS